MYKIFSNWNGMRFIRLMMGLAIVVQSVIVRDAVAGCLGLLLSGMAVFNIGCCGGGTCYRPVSKAHTTEQAG
jgi:hypothetical protein